MAGIHLSAGDLTHPEQALEFLVKKAAAGELRRPVLLIDDCHANTFNVLRFAVNRLLGEGDYVVAEDTMALWRRYSPQALGQRMAAFTDVMVLDRQFARLPTLSTNATLRVACLRV
jgi:hypothetical protein